jgi:lipoprotein NlpI
MLEAAKSDFEEAVRLRPTCVDAFYYLGTIYEKQMQLDHAIDFFSHALMLCPTHAKAAYSRGTCYNMKGNIAAALGQ